MMVRADAARREEWRGSASRDQHSSRLMFDIDQIMRNNGVSLKIISDAV